ncbi:MAG: FHA domain-containing protein [Tepidisphaerales bacterium]
MAIQVVLVMFRSDGERRSFSLPRTITVVGRREDCDLRIPLAEVSRKHCRIINENDTLRIEDLGSSNGTFVNGERAQEAALNAGDTIAVGPVTFVVQVNGVPADDEIQSAGAVNPNTDTSVSMSPEGQGGEGEPNLDGLEHLEQLPEENPPQK